jgi:predicted nucleic acid-binding protein
MARRRILDTSVLIRHWHSRAKAPLERLTEADAEAGARELAQLRGTNCIVTPVYIEFVAGTASAHELQLARAYLSEFDIVDQGRILDEDWVEARHLAERVPRNRRPRQLGDCLIKAIAQRLNYDVDTFDEGM